MQKKCSRYRIGMYGLSLSHIREEREKILQFLTLRKNLAALIQGLVNYIAIRYAYLRCVSGSLWSFEYASTYGRFGAASCRQIKSTCVNRHVQYVIFFHTIDACLCTQNRKINSYSMGSCSQYIRTSENFNVPDTCPRLAPWSSNWSHNKEAFAELKYTHHHCVNGFNEIRIAD